MPSHWSRASRRAGRRVAHDYDSYRRAPVDRAARALARWIASPENPLTARALVNRLWQYHFGRALAASASDFGQLGEEPANPELLDWLASEFVERGWSIKQMHRLILTSATYQQSSAPAGSATAIAKDPQNNLLWRQNCRRLEAEQMRDATLAVAGELDLQMYAPAHRRRSHGGRSIRK